MPSTAFTVRVSGLIELRRALQQIDKNADKELGTALGRVATGIAQKVQGVMPSRSGAAIGTVQTHVRLRGASISIGTGGAGDYVPWLDFGGRVGIRNSVVRAYIRTGRYLYPQIIAARAKTVAAVNQAMAAAARRAGFTVTGVK